MLHSTAFTRLANRSDREAATLVYGIADQQPRFLHDLEAIELIYGPPATSLDYEDFREYQKWMARLCIKQDVFLGAEMGLGKTAAVLWAAKVLIDAGVISQVLIVAPLRVAEETWPEEIAKWGFARELTYRIVTGTEAERRAALDQPAQLTIVNRENLLWLQRTIGVRGWKFDMLIYDEASRLKRGAKRTKPKPRADGTVPPKRLTELGVLRRMRFKFKRVVELSGTPSPNGLIDLWGPIYLIDLGYRLGKSITKYKDRWFRKSRDGYGVEPFDHSEREIMSRLGDVFYSLREEDYLDLPPLNIVDHKVKLTHKEMDRYRTFEREAAMIVKNGAGDEEVIEAVNKGILTGKLLQFANGSMYLGDKLDEETGGKLPRESIRIHDHKLDALESIVEEAMGRPILLAYSYQFDIGAIKKRFPFARMYGETKNDMRDWNAGRIELLITHPASAGHGLNFQHGSNIAVWYGLTWSLELYRQFMKRLHRSGQKADKVFLHQIIAEGTMDEVALWALQARGATQDSITDAVRVRLKKVAA
jgi:SNF2 family DNA or RNA helicase